ncbi:hypothetical protein A8B75_14510 [Sphingomonadales bacterium EhC05]|nr:hypothetical protein A8B75_14510 [Sphingomonadales bacterium EhC05]
MAIEWIKAPLALKYVALGDYDYPSRIRICERAHSGLIQARAEKVVWGQSEENLRILPKRFWWAEGQDALIQNWEAGDFSTWIDEKVEVKAFGVSFDFVAIADLVTADKQATAMRAISVMAEPDWISAKNLHTLVRSKVNPAKAGSAILEACRLGQIAGRAMRASGSVSIRQSQNNAPLDWVAIEWDIPLWFWRDFTDAQKSHQDWQLGKLKGEGRRFTNREMIELQGIHFHKSGLVNLGIEDVSSAVEVESVRGRKPTYDWQKSSSAIWGKIVRGELIPENQAQIERALQANLTRGDKEPSESTVRPYAKLIWDEYNKA